MTPSHGKGLGTFQEPEIRMPDDLAKAIAAAQQPLLEQLQSIEKSMSAIAAAQAAAVLYDKDELRAKMTQMRAAQNNWQVAIDRHRIHLEETSPADAAKAAVTRKMLYGRIGETARELKDLVKADPVVATLLRISGHSFP